MALSFERVIQTLPLVFFYGKILLGIKIDKFRGEYVAKADDQIIFESYCIGCDSWKQVFDIEETEIDVVNTNIKERGRLSKL